MPKRNGKSKNKKRLPRQSLGQRVKNVTLGDLGTLIGAAWEGIGHWTPFNTEVKQIGKSVAATSLSSSGVVYCLSQTAQGVQAGDRTGNSIKAIALELRDVLATTGSNSAIRRIVFVDWDQAGTAPTCADLLTVTGTAEAPLSPFLANNTQRFEILSDEFFDVNTVNKPIVTKCEKFRLDSHVRYLGTTAAAASDGEGSVYVAYVSQASAVYPTVEFYTRLSFVDN